MSKLTHLDDQGRARMVDVGSKDITAREATAECRIAMQPETLKLIVEGGHKKGDVLACARIAGIQAAKRTHELIPLCHLLALDAAEVSFEPDERSSTIRIAATVRNQGRTGVEMEALTAASIAALTVYDMCKAVDRGMVIEQTRLLAKSGGRSGEWQAEP